VFQRILKQIREKVRQRQYVMTLHAEEEMSDDNLSIFDVERSLLTGEIVERQKDAVAASEAKQSPDWPGDCASGEPSAWPFAPVGLTMTSLQHKVGHSLKSPHSLPSPLGRRE
jgi:hypothetical protein